MSCDRFIKYIPSEETSYLRKKHPNAFLLLSLIAERARRISGSPDGLEIGEAHIGDYEEAGIETRDKYRTALGVLENRKHIKKVETCRNRKKCPTGITTIGTKVKLLNSDIWDINPEYDPHQVPHQTPTGPPPDPHEEERIRKNKKEKEEHISPSASPSGNENISFEKKRSSKTIPKIALRDNVLLTQSEYDKLLATHGKSAMDWMLDKLSNQKHSTGRKYKSDYHAIMNWVVDAYTKSSNVKKEINDSPLYDLTGVDIPVKRRLLKTS